MEHLNGIMENNLLDNGGWEQKMDGVYGNLQMEASIKENGA